MGLADKAEERKRGREKKDWPHLQTLKGFSSPLISVAVLGDRVGEGAWGTCSEVLAKSPIITSKLDSAGGGLSDTGALRRMKQRAEIGVESLLLLSASPPVSLYHPSCPFYCTSLPFCHLPCPACLIASPSSLSMTSSLPLISTFNTWLPTMRSLSVLPFPPR